MKNYWQILKNYKSSLIICPILVFIFVVCETSMPTLMAHIVDDGVMVKDMSVVVQIGLYMIIISVIALAANIANIYISSKASVGFGTDLRSKLFEKIQELSFAEIDKFNTASLITRLTNDITRIQQIVLLSLRLLLRSPMMIVMALLFVTRVDPQLALIVVAVIPLLAIGAYAVMKKALPLFMKVQQKIDKLNGVVRENLINIRVVKSFTREESEIDKFATSNKELLDTSLRASNMVIVYFPLMQLIVNTSLIVILWIGGHKVASERLMIGELISLVNYLMQIMMSLMLLAMVVISFARAMASSRRIVEVLETEPSVKDICYKGTTPDLTETGKRAETTKEEEAADSATSITIPAPVIKNGDIAFCNVYFRYPEGEHDIIRNISFDVPAGSMIAIAGATGSGKSSLTQLIPRLYDVTEGAILIDGEDIRSYPLSELHDKIGMVLQKNELFTGTIEENLRWGKEDATEEEIEQVAALAQAHDFITSFPKGYETLLGRGGINVSGGQKQRICIARALLTKPKILILDDSTSSVDINTEKAILNGLRNSLNDTTVIIITQRISTMEIADMVIILEEGGVESIGTPAELMEKSEIYREIYKSQQLVM